MDFKVRANGNIGTASAIADIPIPVGFTATNSEFRDYCFKKKKGIIKVQTSSRGEADLFR
jgi:hypothetical protein